MSIDKNTYKQSCSNWKISPEKKQHIYTGMKVQQLIKVLEYLYWVNWVLWTNAQEIL